MCDTSRIASRPVSTSKAMVWAEMKAMPSPAITACLMVSLEPISAVRVSSASGWSPKKIASAARVPEPGSRMMMVSSSRRSRVISRAAASGWSGGAIITSGWSPNTVASTGNSTGGRPIRAMSSR